MRISGVDFARPVVAETERLDLAFERGDVLLRGFARMLSGPDGVLFGGQTEGVPTHRMKHVVAERAAVTREDVRGGVAFRMADVQARAGRVGEHVEDVVFRRELRCSCLFPFQTVALREGMIAWQRFAGIKCAKRLTFVPDFLPLRFDQMKRILPATARHRGELLGKAGTRGNGRV